jgi:hypothetical protein
MTTTCHVCHNQVSAWSMGQMTYKIAHHYRNDGGLCPGSDTVRSTAR